jgi:hypothetical protein
MGLEFCFLGERLASAQLLGALAILKAVVAIMRLQHAETGPTSEALRAHREALQYHGC